MAVALPIVCLAAAVALIRLGWGGRRHAAPAGWAVAAMALAWLTWGGGAWGLATGLTAGAIFALLAVLYAGAISPARVRRRAAAGSAVGLPLRAEGVTRRVLVFLAVVPLSFLATQWLAFAATAAMKGGAHLDANSVSTMMLVQPLAWSIVMAWQMVLPGPRGMLMPPAVAAVAGTLLWVVA